jgi:hypothetical protein
MKTTPLATLVCTVTAAVFMAVSGLATAQTPVAKTAKTTKPVAASKKEAVAKKKPPVSANRTNLKTTAKNVAAGIEAAEAAMTPAELAIAERVHVGSMPCELGASVNLTLDDKAPGYFNMQGKNFKYRMFPVATTTGAIRLEDQKAGAVWLQLANKSMLMNQKLGIRLADECMSPTQVAMAEVLKRNPPPSVLDAPKPAVLPVLPAEPLQPSQPAQ